MKRIGYLWMLLFLFMAAVPMAAETELKEKLAALDGVCRVEPLESDVYAEKYVVYIRQMLDPHRPEAGTFMQRVIVGHAGFDRPTVLVTEGYGGAYALNPKYREELTGLLDANLVFVEHRYFLESTPDSLDWTYLTAENSAYDLHRVNRSFRALYPEKWISTGISKGGQTTLLYRAYFPDDVDFSVPYVAPLNRDVEDGRHEPFLRQVGTAEERARIEDFQKEVLKRKEAMVPLLDAFCREKGLTFRIPMAEVLDYCVLEYPFALWQWGTPVDAIPALTADDGTLFGHLTEISGPDYFAEDQPNLSFFVQAARELGYYGYDTAPFEGLLTIGSSKGYLNRLMLPQELIDKVEFRPELYRKVYRYLAENDPKMICIYGEVDPWSATRVPDFEGKKNLQIYIQPGGNHRSRIGNMPEETKKEILDQLNRWLEE